MSVMVIDTGQSINKAKIAWIEQGEVTFKTEQSYC